MFSFIRSRKIHWRIDRLATPVFLGFPCGSGPEESVCSVGDVGLIPGLQRSPGEGKGYPLQDSDLESSMDSAVDGGHTKSQTGLKRPRISIFKKFLLGSSTGGSRVIRRCGRSWRPGKHLFNFRYRWRFETDSVVGELVEKRG